MERMSETEAGLAQRVMKEVLDTPALKEIILLHMRGVKPERAHGLARTALWEDPAISMSFLGTLPQALDWLLTLLAELGEQLESIPPPLLREILANIAGGLDRERMEEAAASWSRVLKGLASAGGEERGAPDAARMINAAISRLDRATSALERDPQRAARALAELWRRLDRMALRRSLRRLASVLVAALREGKRTAVLPDTQGGICREGERPIPSAEEWRRFMYAWNTVLCLSLGPALMLKPGLLRRLLRWPGDDPVMTGIYGSIVTSVGILSAAALKDERKRERFTPVFSTQILYKTLTCLMLRRELRRRSEGKLGLRVFYWFFLLYIAMLAGAIRKGGAAIEGNADEGREEASY